MNRWWRQKCKPAHVFVWRRQLWRRQVESGMSLGRWRWQFRKKNFGDGQEKQSSTWFESWGWPGQTSGLMDEAPYYLLLYLDWSIHRRFHVGRRHLRGQAGRRSNRFYELERGLYEAKIAKSLLLGYREVQSIKKSQYPFTSRRNRLHDFPCRTWWCSHRQSIL